MNIYAKKIEAIPVPTLRRLPLYYNYLKEQLKKGVQYTSATNIANDLSLIPIQVRKDLSFTGIIGKPKLGYEVKELINFISNFLGWNNTKNAFLVGVGNLGEAILGYNGFKEIGVNILCGFDMDDKKIGKEINGIKILHIDKMTSLVKRMKIKIGIITVPADSAQKIADLMVSSGIKAIWNFSPIKLKVPQDVIVQSENLATSLSVLVKKLEIKIKNGETNE